MQIDTRTEALVQLRRSSGHAYGSSLPVTAADIVNTGPKGADRLFGVRRGAVLRRHRGLSRRAGEVTFSRTSELVDVVKGPYLRCRFGAAIGPSCVPGPPHRGQRRTDSLRRALPSFSLLAPGGCCSHQLPFTGGSHRQAVLCRKAGLHCPGFPICVCGVRRRRAVDLEAIIPSMRELELNPGRVRPNCGLLGGSMPTPARSAWIGGLGG